MASRCEQTRTDESAYPVGSSVSRNAELALQYLAATELQLLPDNVTLRRCLTVKSIISTTSSFAVQFQHASTRPELQQFNQIGEGLQGTIFEQLGLRLVMKKEKPGNETRPSNLKHEYEMHRRVFYAFSRYSHSSGVRVPQLYNFLDKADDTFWSKNLTKLPTQYRVRSDVVMMERILPLPKVIRRALVTYFLPYQQTTPITSEVVFGVLDAAPNKHCLARIYLGRRTATRPTPLSLRNFPLYLDDMELLGLTVDGFALSMGRAFAVMHWGAGVNGDDVEFVLGTEAITQGGDGRIDLQHRSVGLYLLDFGQCDAVNQLFIPHYQKSPELFAAFKKGYMEAGQEVLAHKGLENQFNLDDFMNEYEEYAEDFL